MRTTAKESLSDSQQFAQLALVHEDITDLAHSLVAALGGAKKVGPKLFPQKTETAATRYLLDCLNPDREHDLGLEGFITLLRWSRERAIHLGMYWLCDELGYARPTPIDSADARAEIQRQLTDLLRQAEPLMKKLQTG